MQDTNDDEGLIISRFFSDLSEVFILYFYYLCIEFTYCVRIRCSFIILRNFFSITSKKDHKQCWCIEGTPKTVVYVNVYLSVYETMREMYSFVNNA